MGKKIRTVDAKDIHTDNRCQCCGRRVQPNQEKMVVPSKRGPMTFHADWTGCRDSWAQNDKFVRIKSEEVLQSVSAKPISWGWDVQDYEAPKDEIV
jgi:hypothetical protein